MTDCAYATQVKVCEKEGIPVEALDGLKAGMTNGAYLTKSQEDLKKYKLMASLKIGFALDLLKRQVSFFLIICWTSECTCTVLRHSGFCWDHDSFFLSISLCWQPSWFQTFQDPQYRFLHNMLLCSVG